MGRKGNCFLACFSHDSKKRKYQTGESDYHWGSGKDKHPDPSPPTVETVPAPPPPRFEDVEVENEQTKHVYSVVKPSAVVDNSAFPPEPPVAEVVQPVLNESTTVPEVVPEPAGDEVAEFRGEMQNSGNSKEDAAAVKIQTAFRGYLARRALRALRRLDRLKTLMDGDSVKRQATTTLRCMQTLARVQSQIRARRIRMSEENQALLRQLTQKRERELEKLRMGEEWDSSLHSKEQLEANLLHKFEAAIRRERALAYAFSHQQTWKNSNTMDPTYMDPINPQWGWSWLERWMAARPWETRNTGDKELNDHSSVKSSSHSIGGEISKSYALRELNGEKPSPTPKNLKRPSSHKSPSTPPSKETSASSVARKLKSASLHRGLSTPDDDTRSLKSVQSERYRRYSAPGTSVRDDESLASSSTSTPSYMAPTKSAKAKSRMQSPLGVEKSETPDRGSVVGSAKKRLSFPLSPAPAGPRRQSLPAKIETSPAKDIGVNIEHNVSNGGSN